MRLRFIEWLLIKNSITLYKMTFIKNAITLYRSLSLLIKEREGWNIRAREEVFLLPQNKYFNNLLFSPPHPKQHSYLDFSSMNEHFFHCMFVWPFYSAWVSPCNNKMLPLSGFCYRVTENLDMAHTLLSDT